MSELVKPPLGKAVLRVRWTLGGFTLVELIVVITILAILATVGFLSLSGYSDDARAATVKANVRTVYSAILTESTTTGNSPRYYVDHSTGAALSGTFVFVDGKQVALTGGDFGVGDSNYTAGNPRWDRLRMNGEKFKLAFGHDKGLPYAFGALWDEARAAYSTGELSVGAVDIFKTANGRRRNLPVFQVAAIVPGSKNAVVTGNYVPGADAGSPGLLRDSTSEILSAPLTEPRTFAVIEGDDVSGRKWSDGTFASSCRGYSSSPAGKSYAGSVGNGIYLVDPDGNGGNAPFPAYCDMTESGGGWTLISNRRAGTTNVESCGTNIAEFFTNGCGTPNAISASDSYAMTAAARASIDKREQLVLQYLNGVADTGNAYIVRFSENLELFPNTDLLQHVPLTGVCDFWNANCDTSDVFWKYIGDFWYHSSQCFSGSSYRTDHRGNYGVCHNGAYDGGNASAYSSSSAFGNRSGYEETKLWAHGNWAAAYQERIFVR